MTVEIVEEPMRFHLHGIVGVVEDGRYGEVVNMVNSPPGVRGQSSGGRSQYNSTPLSSGSRRYSASLTPWSLAPSSWMPASSTRRNATARAFRVGYRMAVW